MTFRAQLAVCSAASEEDGTESTSMIFDLKTGKSTKLVGHKPTVSNIRFSLQGDFVITSGYDKVLRVWTADDGNLCHTLEFREEEERAHDGKVECMSLHRTNDSLIASSGEDRSICLWNIYTGECTDSISTKESAADWTGNPVALTFMQEEYSNYLLAGLDCRGDQGAVVKIWDVNTTSCDEIEAHKKSIVCVGCGNSGQILTASEDQSVKMSDIRTLSVVQTYMTYQPDANVVSFSPCERYIISAGSDNKIHVFDQRYALRPVHTLSHMNLKSDASNQGVLSCAWTNEGFLVSGGEDAAVRMWNIYSGTPEVKVYRAHSAAVNFVAVSPNGDLLASGGDEFRVNLYGLDDHYKLSTTRISDISNTINSMEDSV